MKVIKTKDNRFKGSHPSGVNVGEEREGRIATYEDVENSIKGLVYMHGDKARELIPTQDVWEQRFGFEKGKHLLILTEDRFFVTSEILEIRDTEFDTKNSTYEYLL